jgi:hypothetical protein
MAAAQSLSEIDQKESVRTIATGRGLLCFILGLLGVLPLIVLTPPFRAPDEVQDFLRAYQLSELRLTASMYEGEARATLPASLEAKAMLPSSLAELAESLVGTKKAFIEHDPASQPFQRTLSEWDRPLEPDRRELVSLFAITKAPPSYLPQDVADLQPGAAKPVIGERPPEEVTCRPKDDEALVDLAHLPRSPHDAAAVDDRSQSIEGNVLGDNQFRTKLARPVERAAPRERKVLGDAAGRPAGARTPVRDDKSCLGRDQRQFAQRCDRIYPARRQEDDRGPMLTGVTETIDRADQVRVDQISITACKAGLDGGLGRALDEQIQISRVNKVLTVADVAVAEFNPARSQPRQRQLATPPL